MVLLTRGFAAEQVLRFMGQPQTQPALLEKQPMQRVTIALSSNQNSFGTKATTTALYILAVAKFCCFCKGQTRDRPFNVRQGQEDTNDEV